MLAKSSTLTTHDLPETIRTSPTIDGDHVIIPIGMPLDEVETVLIHETLKRTQGDKNLAAKLLGVAPRTIYRKLEE